MSRTRKTVCCPYNPAHIMPQQTLLNHVHRCTAPNKSLFTSCRYNPCHIYLKTEIKGHEQRCKDGKNFKKEQSDSDSWGDFGKQQEEETKPTVEKKSENQVSRVLDQSIEPYPMKPVAGQNQRRVDQELERSLRTDYDQSVQSFSLSNLNTTQQISLDKNPKNECKEEENELQCSDWDSEEEKPSNHKKKQCKDSKNSDSESVLTEKDGDKELEADDF